LLGEVNQLLQDLGRFDGADFDFVVQALLAGFEGEISMALSDAMTRNKIWHAYS